MRADERAEVWRTINEIMEQRAKLRHDERAFVHLMQRALEDGRAVNLREVQMLDSIWERVRRAA
jgi:hypothetical protein